MMRFVRDIRLLPVVLLATGLLFAVKVLGLILDGGYTLGGLSWNGNTGTAAVPAERPVDPARSQVTEAFRLTWTKQPSSSTGEGDITGSVDAPPPKTDAAKPDAAKPELAKPVEALRPNGTSVPLDQPAVSPGERAVLERLQARRQEIEARAREVEIRESLLKSNADRLQSQGGAVADKQSAVAAQKKEEVDAGRFKSVVTMYENMKAKDAAKIFDRLDIKILVDIASQINPRRMSDIMAQMQPENAERLTVELAGRSSAPDKSASDDLPKIEGRPNGG